MIVMAFVVRMTGPIDLGSEATDPVQPHPAWFDAIARDDASGEERARLLVCVRPEGWRVPPGEDQLVAERTGVRALSPLPLLMDMFDASEVLVVCDAVRTMHALGAWRHQVGRPWTGSPWRDHLRVVDVAASFPGGSPTAPEMLAHHLAEVTP